MSNENNFPTYVDINLNNQERVSDFSVPLYCRDDLKSILIPNGEIKDRISKLADEIVHDLYDENGIFSKSTGENTDELLCICVLKGVLNRKVLQERTF